MNEWMKEHSIHTIELSPLHFFSPVVTQELHVTDGERTNQWVNEWTNEWVDEQMDEMNEWMKMNEWMNEWT